MKERKEGRDRVDVRDGDVGPRRQTIHLVGWQVAKLFLYRSEVVEDQTAIISTYGQKIEKNYASPPAYFFYRNNRVCVARKLFFEYAVSCYAHRSTIAGLFRPDVRAEFGATEVHRPRFLRVAELPWGGAGN